MARTDNETGKRSAVYGGGNMSRISLNAMAPDFALADHRGNPIRLSDYNGAKHVLLVFNRGFV
jgi:hypothetical protein